ncbi:hypothetical protein ACWGLL_11880 [Brevundimonas sp. NPDC055814]
MAGLPFVLSLALLGQTVTAESLPDAPPLTVVPAWRTPPAPTPDDYPHFASVVGINGEVQVQCRTSVEGRLSACTPMSARPANLGFEEIAVRLVEAGLVTPAQDASGPVEAEIIARVPFSVPMALPPKPPAWDGPEPNPSQRAAGEDYARRHRADPLIRSRLPWGLQPMSPEMRQTVKSWIDELFARSDQVRGLGMARVLAKRDLDVFPRTKPDDWDDWTKEMASAMADLFDGTEAVAELRRRFCARYDCGPALEGDAAP